MFKYSAEDAKLAGNSEKRGTVNDDIRQSGIGFMLFLWLVLFGTNGHSADALASTSASVESAVSVNSAVVDFWGAAFISKAVPGRLIIRIAAAAMAPEDAGGDPVTLSHVAVVSNRRFAQFTMADFIELSAGERILSGATISTLMVTASDVTGFAAVTVAYN